MAKERVRAFMTGYDNVKRRNPGDEFDFDIEKHGHGNWFEKANEPLQEHAAEVEVEVEKPVKRRGRKPKRDDDERLA